MDIENLTKSQIVLLTLLVSFVTSIATGIVTVSLMEQAPPTVAQTVNRVVERTIERVVPQESQAAAPVVTTERTVIVREADLIAQAVAIATPSMIRLYDRDTEEFVSFGIAIANDRLITDVAATIDGANLITRDGDAIIEFVTTERNSSLGVAVLAVATSTGATPWKPIKLSTKLPSLGQTAVALTGEESVRVTNSIVTTVTNEHVLETNIPTDATFAGGPLINVDGELLGLRTNVSYTQAPGGFIQARSISSMLSPATHSESEVE
jgi:hypothetical protein